MTRELHLRRDVSRGRPTRRELLRLCGIGMGGLALAWMLRDEQDGPAGPRLRAAAHPLTPRPPHFAPRARRIVHIFANGGPSHIDTFDPKPELDRWDGQPLKTTLRTERNTGSVMRSPFRFSRHGKSGLPISELFPLTATHADDLCVIRSMQADIPNHEPSLMLMNCGDARTARPSLGSWLTYGLGSENRNLPGFVVLSPGGYPVKESENWRSAFLPQALAGTYIDPSLPDPGSLIAHTRNADLSPKEQRRQLDLLQQLNVEHAAAREQSAALDARIQSFEMAYRMQFEAAEAFDVRKEPEAVRAAYGPGDQGRQYLIARRLLERDVRFVQIWHGQGQPWDSHDRLESNHRRLARECDQPIAALLGDLKARDMLKDTLVIWGGEFGRTPVVEMKGGGPTAGRDHNPFGFSMWLAGGGVRGGHIHGATDEFGFRAVQDPVHVHDLHATILHLAGLDHERLTYHYAGRDFRLTDTAGRVVRDLLA